MNTNVIAPEVQDFLAVVRRQLADLDPDEQRDITEGLEADLTDLVAERGGEALGDPVAYARELRAAAGLAPEMGRSRHHVDLSGGVHSFLDEAHQLFDRSAAALPGDTAGVLASVQPAWWVLRAWLAVEVVAYFLGSWNLQVIPGSNLPGTIALLVAGVLSVQLGRGRLWPGDRWRKGAGLRMILLALNCFAVLMVPVVLDRLQHDGSMYGYQEVATARPHGLQLNGVPVRNIYPYDAQGHPLTGIQLLDRSGHPLSLDVGGDAEEVWNVRLVPWLNGRTQLLNVFPLPEQALDPATGKPLGAGSVLLPPVNSLPPVSQAGVTPSVMQSPTP
jgi:hypothetical protein